MVSPATAAPTERERIMRVLDRQDVHAQLLAQGVDPVQARARVAALSDDEAAVLAARMDELPAGGFVQVLAAAVVAAGYVIVMAIGAIGYGVAALIRLATRAGHE